jgi:hypothetical protein
MKSEKFSGRTLLQLIGLLLFLTCIVAGINDRFNFIEVREIIASSYFIGGCAIIGSIFLVLGFGGS